MPLLDEHQIVSVDDHLVEHPRVWQERLPAAMREAGPRIVEWTASTFGTTTVTCSRPSGSTPSQASRPRSGAWTPSATRT